MKFQVVFLDIDGTLMDGQARISDASRQALRAVLQRGVRVVLNTGRNLSDLRSISKLLGFRLPAIGHNGAYIADDHLDKTIYESPIPTPALREVLRIARAFGAEPTFSTADSFCVQDDFGRFLEQIGGEHAINSANTLCDPAVTVPAGEWDAFFAVNSILKINLYHTRQEVLLSLAEAMKELKAVSLCCLGKRCAEFNGAGVDKGTGIARYLELCGIPKSASLAIGDANNDLPMLHAAGFTVAMENGEEIFKKSADFITKSIDEDGLAFALQKFVLKAV